MDPSSLAHRGVHGHVVWLGSPLPYHARLAVESALVAMPDTTISLHHLGERPGGPEADALAAYPRVRFERIVPSELFEGCPGGARRYVELLRRLPDGAAAAASNVLRLGILQRDGGVYLDTDVLVVRGLHDPRQHGAYVGRELVWNANRARAEGRLTLRRAIAAAPWALTWVARRADSRLSGGRLRTATRLPDRGTRLQVNNAVIGAPAGSAFVHAALQRALAVDPLRRYALGPSLLDDVVTGEPALARVVPPSRFYAVPPSQSYRYFEDTRFELPIDAQVIHYVASNHRALLAGLRADDPRFGNRSGLFWRHGRRVQSQVAAGAAATPVPTPLLRRAG